MSKAVLSLASCSLPGLGNGAASGNLGALPMKARILFSLVPLAFALSSPAAVPVPEIVTVNTPRTFPKITSAAAWRTRAMEIRDQALVSCGLLPMPPKTPLNTKISGRIDRDGYSVEKVYFESMPGVYVAGNLYRPRGQGAGPFAATINPHGHWEEGRLTESKDGSAPARCISQARHGIIAFTYDMVGYNDTAQFNATLAAPHPGKRPNYDPHAATFGQPTNLYWNITLMGLQTWNAVRALDFLESLPDVDRKRLGSTGESGGGTQTFMLGAIDDRLAIQAPIVMVSHSMQGGCRCENAPGLRIRYSNMEVAASAAPRPQFLVAATGDWTKTTDTIEGPSIEWIYQLAGAGDRFGWKIFEAPHNYNLRTREAVYGFLGKTLRPEAFPNGWQEAAYTKEPDAELRVFPDEKFPANAKTEGEAIGYLIGEAEKNRAALIKPESAGLRARLLAATFQIRAEDIQPTGFKETLVATDAGGGFQLKRFETDDGVRVAVYQPTKPKRRPVLLVAEANDKSVATAALPDKALADLLGRGHPVAVLESISRYPGRVAGSQAAHERPDYFTTFTCYNRTLGQVAVRDIVRAFEFVKLTLKRTDVVASGGGSGAVWVSMASPWLGDIALNTAGLPLDLVGAESVKLPLAFVPGIGRLGGVFGVPTLRDTGYIVVHGGPESVGLAANPLKARFKAKTDPLKVMAKILSPVDVMKQFKD